MAGIGSPVAVVVRQLTEHVQGDVELIGRLKDAGVVPNARVTVQVGDEPGGQGGELILIPGHQEVELPHHMGHAGKVEKDRPVHPARCPNARRAGSRTPSCLAVR